MRFGEGKGIGKPLSGENDLESNKPWSSAQWLGS